jgi:hypothetical protein
MLQQDLKIWIILIHITDVRRGLYMIFGGPVPKPGKFWGFGVF